MLAAPLTSETTPPTTPIASELAPASAIQRLTAKISRKRSPSVIQVMTRSIRRSLSMGARDEECPTPGATSDHGAIADRAKERRDARGGRSRPDAKTVVGREEV